MLKRECVRGLLPHLRLCWRRSWHRCVGFTIVRTFAVCSRWSVSIIAAPQTERGAPGVCLCFATFTSRQNDLADEIAEARRENPATSRGCATAIIVWPASNSQHQTQKACRRSPHATHWLAGRRQKHMPRRAGLFSSRESWNGSDRRRHVRKEGSVVGPELPPAVRGAAPGAHPLGPVLTHVYCVRAVNVMACPEAV